ncbi:MAG: alpha-galactosidase [Candidatus Glassbacteria bacterium]|nr:alpha-galactosidase [Candidatus Glassbacteria bacterium]
MQYGRKSAVPVIILAGLVAAALSGPAWAGTDKITVIQGQGRVGAVEYALTAEGLVLDNGVIRLAIDDGLHIRPALHRDGGLVGFVSETGASPAFHAVLSGFELTRLRVLRERLGAEEVSDDLGRGVRFSLEAVSARYGLDGIQVEQAVSLTFYERFPAVVVAGAEFKNVSRVPARIDRLAGNCYRLDRRLLDPEAPSWKFASYQGAAYLWGRDYSLIWIDSGFEQKNFMGLKDRMDTEGEGGGTPLVDLWAPELGLAVACAEPGPRWVSLPVRACPDGLVEVSVIQEPEEELGQKTVLGPGESCSTVRSALFLHRLDFHDALRSYADLLRAQGIDIPLSSPPQAYIPYWKSWGFRMDFTLEQIYGALPQLKRIGIRWANLDDGWFTWYGDWDPNPAPGKFPGGEADMRAFVQRMHRQGFKTNPWWYPQGVSPESDLAREHPEWLVQDRQGNPAISHRGQYYLCPVHPECIAHVESLVEKFLADWDFDGLYIDACDLSTVPPCFNPAHGHSSPLDPCRGQYRLFEAIYRAAQRIKPGCPVEMCICGIPHDPFKMPYYNVATTSDPVNLAQVRRRIKVEKAFRGPTFCVGDCYQIPMDEYAGCSVPESFESAMGTGAQVTTFYEDLSRDREKKWKRWVELYNRLGLSSGEYLNLYDIAFDRPEAHVVRKEGRLYYGFFADDWSKGASLPLRGLERDKTYSVRDYARGLDLGTVSGGRPVIHHAFKECLLLEVTPLKGS